MMMEHIKTIGIDFDDVIYPSLECALDIHNNLNNDNICIDDCVDWGMDGIKEMYNRIIFIPFACKDNAIDVIKKLSEKYSIYIITASTPYEFIKKCEWIEVSMPWFPIDKVILCKHKHLINVDMLIDDCPDNVENFENVSVCLTMPYNKDCKCDYRINKLQNIFDL